MRMRSPQGSAPGPAVQIRSDAVCRYLSGPAITRTRKNGYQATRRRRNCCFDRGIGKKGCGCLSHPRPTPGRSPVLVHSGQTRPRLSVLGARCACRSPLGVAGRRLNRAKSCSYMAMHMPHICLNIPRNMTGYSVVMASPMAVLAGLEDDAPGAVLGERPRTHQQHRYAADYTLRDEDNLRSGMNVVALIRKDLCSASKDRGDAELVGLQLRCIISYDTHLFAGALPLQSFAQL